MSALSITLGVEPRPRTARKQHPPLAQVLQTILAALPDAVYVVDPHDPEQRWPIVYCNEAACQLYGRPKDQIIGRSLASLERESCERDYSLQYVEYVRKHGHDQLHGTYRHHDGHMISVETAISLMVINNHEYLLRRDRDITTHKQVEIALQQRISYERHAAEIVQRLVSLPLGSIDQGLHDILDHINKYLSVDRTYLLCYAPEEHSCWIAHESHSEGCKTQGVACRPISNVYAAWLDKEVKEQGFVQISDSTSEAKHLWQISDSPQAMLGVRAHVSDTMSRILICEVIDTKREWSNDEIIFLQTIATIIGTITERQEVIANLQMNNARYRIVTEYATDVISLHDPSGVCYYCSPTLRTILGYEPIDLVGRLPFEFMHPDDHSTALARGKIHDNGAVTTTFRVRHRDGYYVWMETSIRAVCDPITGAIHEVIAVTRDIDARKMYEAKIEQLAFYDPLTLLGNRRHFHEQVQRTLCAFDQQNEQIALLYLDLDHFKKVNDTLGHDAGDELLMQVAARLHSQLSEHDTLARLGGDEFAILLRSQDIQVSVADIAQRIVNQIKLPFQVRNQTIHLGVSIGIARAPLDGQSFEDLLKHADIAMYRAKSEGDTFKFFDPSLSAYSHEQLQLEDELRRAIASNSLTLHYQPIFDLNAQSIISVEALVRWQHPTRGLLMPSEFVPIAEESGLIRSLDRWVVLAALRQLADWAAQGKRINVSINLSARTVYDDDLGQYVRDCLRASGAPASRVIFEVT